MKLCPVGLNQKSPEEGDKNCLNSELWHACAGPLISLPSVGSHVVYFPQGHSEQVAASTNKEVGAHTPNYPTLSPQLICQLHNATMHADVETDEVYAQLTLQPLSPQEQKEVSFFPVDLGASSKQPTNYFCKNLTASDTSTHGGFSVPRRAAEKVFPPLDFSLQPPVQELIALDLHNNEWKFRHVFRGQPKRHLLTTGWSVFVSAKRLVAGDSVLFIWNDKNQLLLGIRRANRQQTVVPSSILSSDSMHLGLLAAAAHAASTNSRFTIFYNPRASPCEFVIPLAKYVKAVYHTRVSVGVRFRMLFETEESSVRRYMGTITGLSDLDPARWPNSQWRSVKVGWDESTGGGRQQRVSLWEIEPLTSFSMYPSPFSLRLKRPWPLGIPSFAGVRPDGMGLSSLVWLGGDVGDPRMQVLNQGMNVSPWIQPSLNSSLLAMQNNMLQPMVTIPFQQSQPVGNQPMSTDRPQLLHTQQQLLHQNVLDPQMTMPHILPLHQNFPESNGKPVAVNITSPLLGPHEMPDWPMKRVAFDPLISSGTSQTHNPVSLPPFPSRDCLIEQETTEPQNHFNFGVNSISNLQEVGTDSDNPTVGFALHRFMSGSTPDYCIDNNLGHENPQDGTFVKVYKSGSLGRSLDITKFRSYRELRNELAQMFGLEGQLEDHLRSGWQLVFVDRENDVLLLGDDPWTEFVNSVWCIKILSPDEVLEMGKHGLQLLNSAPCQMPSIGTLDF